MIDPPALAPRLSPPDFANNPSCGWFRDVAGRFSELASTPGRVKAVELHVKQDTLYMWTDLYDASWDDGETMPDFSQLCGTPVTIVLHDPVVVHSENQAERTMLELLPQLGFKVADTDITIRYGDSLPGDCPQKALFSLGKHHKNHPERPASLTIIPPRSLSEHSVLSQGGSATRSDALNTWDRAEVTDHPYFIHTGESPSDEGSIDNMAEKMGHLSTVAAGHTVVYVLPSTVPKDWTEAKAARLRDQMTKFAKLRYSGLWPETRVYFVDEVDKPALLRVKDWGKRDRLDRLTLEA